MINWMKYKWVYLMISVSLILGGVYSLVVWGINLGVDFTGGAQIEYSFGDGKISEENLNSVLTNNGLKVISIRKTDRGSYLLKFSHINDEERNNIHQTLKNYLSFDIEELSFENLGPSVGLELIKKTFYALIISSIAILFWIAYQFKSIKFGLAASIATVHDSLILLGSFSILGHFYYAQVDFLFVTAMLTILSFSVHDTIVVFDRIREQKKKSDLILCDLANLAITETMIRSLNNSFTIIFMLFALIILGGSSIKWFATALLIGTISGTYSSPFVAVPLLTFFEKIEVKYLKVKN